ncbi:hypothetical protein [Methylobacterium dankookense]|uniref:Uncharacterized protein n=1 Tax=Methylobacterium dankookense TaxID=560405 RepID=A0A564FXI1_9HYPH|nr:hypothetical protein [Methylobacterium dankookense]GJD54266.1 hypothetical protein IFDJLNFL_0134 [Methylobacterium dankookense]VUF12889.1 hypothetical protein MTDSW087_02584 [Methylobacterium dankookense]
MPDPDLTPATSSATLAARLHPVADDLLVCRIEHLPTFAVPLGLAGNPGARLEAWALAVSPQDAGEAISYLLLLRVAAGSREDFRPGGGFVLATHFRDLPVEILTADRFVLTPHEYAVLARSALTVQLGEDDGARRAADALLAFLAPGLDTFLDADGEAELLDLGLDGRTLTVTGGYLPQWIVLRAEDGYHRFAVEEAALRFDGPATAALTLDPAWTPGLLADRAILVGRDDHRIGVLRRRRGA